MIKHRHVEYPKLPLKDTTDIESAWLLNFLYTHNIIIKVNNDDGVVDKSEIETYIKTEMFYFPCVIQQT